MGMVRVSLGEPRPAGDYDGFIEIDFKNPGISNIAFEVTGRITPLIEAKPFREGYASLPLVSRAKHHGAAWR